MVQNLQLLPVHHRSGPVRDRRHPVPQKCLLRRHIHIRNRWLRPQPRASTQSHQQTNRKRTKPESPHPIGLSTIPNDNQPASHRVTAPLFILQSGNATTGTQSGTPLVRQRNRNRIRRIRPRRRRGHPDQIPRRGKAKAVHRQVRRPSKGSRQYVLPAVIPPQRLHLRSARVRRPRQRRQPLPVPIKKPEMFPSLPFAT